jgi:hypothetical protein
MDERDEYEVVRPRKRVELGLDLESDRPNVICDALFSAAQHKSDWRWSQQQCLRMLGHESTQVRSCALIALGEIAQFQGQLDLAIVLPEMQRFASDPVLGPNVEDAMLSIRAAGLAIRGE